MRNGAIRIGGFAFAAALALLGGCGAEDGLGMTAQESHSWNGYHWARTANPFTLKLGDNLGSAWRSSFSGAITDWSKSTVLDMTAVAGGAKPRNCRPTSGRDEICSASYGNTGWLGVAQIWASGKHITQGTVKLNDFYFGAGSTYNTSAWRNLVTCQEIGHTIGLDHQDENFDNANLGTCMDYTSDPSTNQHPNKHDYDELVIIYTHLDSTSTVDQNSVVAAAAGAPGFALDMGNGVREDVGEVIASGNHWTLFYKGLGGDNAVLTNVTWAD